MEGGNLSIVALEVREVEVIGESLLLPGEPATNTRATVMEFSVLNVHRGTYFPRTFYGKYRPN